MTFESEGLLIVDIYTWLPPTSYVVFLTTLVYVSINQHVWLYTHEIDFGKMGI